MTDDANAANWPTELRVSPERDTLTIGFRDGRRYVFTSEYLRVMSPSAEVQGHSPDQRKLQPGKSWVTLEGAEPVGNYAVRLKFTDGHNTGIYSWDFFADHGPEIDDRFAAYVRELEDNGLSR